MKAYRYRGVFDHAYINLYGTWVKVYIMTPIYKIVDTPRPIPVVETEFKMNRLLRKFLIENLSPEVLYKAVEDGII